MIRMRTLTGAIALLLALSSCSSGGDYDFSVISKDGSTALVRDRDTAGMEALLSGTVIKLPSGCFGMKSDNEKYPVIWPKGTSLSDDASALRMSDGTLVPQGTNIEAGGGIISVDQTEGELPPSCVADSVAILNSVTIIP